MISLGDASRRPLRFPFVTPLTIAGRYWISIPSAMFMHAGWAHILGNTLFFSVLRPEIEDMVGRVRFLIFYLLGGLAATAAQVLIHPAYSIYRRIYLWHNHGQNIRIP